MGPAIFVPDPARANGLTGRSGQSGSLEHPPGRSERHEFDPVHVRVVFAHELHTLTGHLQYSHPRRGPRAHRAGRVRAAGSSSLLPKRATVADGTSRRSRLSHWSREIYFSNWCSCLWLDSVAVRAPMNRPETCIRCSNLLNTEQLDTRLPILMIMCRQGICRCEGLSVWRTRTKVSVLRTGGRTQVCDSQHSRRASERRQRASLCTESFPRRWHKPDRSMCKSWLYVTQK